jgi:hypothetical protein
MIGFTALFWYRAWLHFTIHYYAHASVHIHVFTSCCSVAASNGRHYPSSGFQNNPRLQLLASHSTELKQFPNWLTYSVTHARAIAQAVSRWLPTAVVRGSKPDLVMWDVVGQSGAGAGFLRVPRFPLQSSFAPPMTPQSPSCIIRDMHNRPMWPQCWDLQGPRGPEQRDLRNLNLGDLKKGPNGGVSPTPQKKNSVTHQTNYVNWLNCPAYNISAGIAQKHRCYCCAIGAAETCLSAKPSLTIGCCTAASFAVVA